MRVPKALMVLMRRPESPVSVRNNYKFWYSDKMVTWWPPDDFQRLEEQRAQGAFRMSLPRWRSVVGIGSIMLFSAGLYFDSVAQDQSYLPIAILVAAVILAWIARIFDVTTPRKPSEAILNLERPDWLKWKRVNWWRIAPVEGMPDVKAVELGYTFFRRGFTKRLGFHPAEVDENVVVSFLRRVAPEKEKGTE